VQELRLQVGGAPVHAELHEARGQAKGGLVLVHGFNSCLRELGDLPGHLAAGGYRVMAFDQRGYGLSGGTAGRTSVEAAVEDIVAAAGAVRQGMPRLRLGIVGHSLGGAYALAAMGRTGLFSAGVVAHPVDRLFDELSPLEKVGYHALGKWAEWRMARGGEPGTIPYKATYEKLFVSREAAAQARADAFLQGRVSLANYRPALTMSASTWAKAVRQPVLVIASPHDRAVRPGHTRAVYDALAGPKEWWVHEGGHSCFRDLDSGKVMAATAAWFDRHLGGPA
jgi:alpha-beta hydrolase superfamily lysophospholipase